MPGWVQPHLQQILGQPFIVENRAGAAGRIGTGVVAKSEPDGHSLLMTTESSLVIAPHVGVSLGYDPRQVYTAGFWDSCVDAACLSRSV